MERDRPVLRVSHEQGFVDIRAGRASYVGIGSECDIRLPLRGPVEPWFVIRHAGVWTVRAIDGSTQLWVDGRMVPSDRGARVGDSAEQELRVRRGGLETALTLQVAPLSPPVQEHREMPPAPTPAPDLAPDRAVSSQALAPAEPLSLTEPLAPPEPFAPIELSAQPAPPVPFESPTPMESFVSPYSSLPQDPYGQPSSYVRPDPYRPSDPVVPEPAEQPDQQFRDVDTFLQLMATNNWPGWLRIHVVHESGSRSREHVVVLTWSITGGKNTRVLLPPPAIPIPGAETTIYHLLRNSDGHFPSGVIEDSGLLLTDWGELLAWRRKLDRKREVIESPPPPLRAGDQVQVCRADLAEADLLALLEVTTTRLIPRRS